MSERKARPIVARTPHGTFTRTTTHDYTHVVVEVDPKGNKSVYRWTSRVDLALKEAARLNGLAAQKRYPLLYGSKFTVHAI